MADVSHPNGLPALPPVLAAAFAAATAGGGKRERTQGALVRAAVEVFGARGVAAATIQEVAQVAGLTPATVYNHFASKEELLERVIVVLAQSLCRAIAESQARVADGAERVAIGQRRYVLLAQESPGWALLLLDLAATTPSLLAHIEPYPLADLRLAAKQKRLKVPNEAIGLDVLQGICTMAMRRVALGLAPAKYDVAVATVVLRALGMGAEEAAEVARRPLPELAVPAPADALPSVAARQRAPRSR
ncbi:helix-turn-helix transcriptional regulator [Ramlibacter sp. USB13]|uniref:Helix-turn-helix transcriptional regulator n=1 Tax=Ramlibacter cellulosilyticus TaxID=2764187 RepID=A0A923SBV3_9BURK|nr:helix-turn-helix domain-containing protein [Ramlibacter cellulosilyticus]MBC5784270.1 helix-turn-helix transcriptional regulator [Ramlibacter cellulosilyticus]